MGSDMVPIKKTLLTATSECISQEAVQYDQVFQRFCDVAGLNFTVHGYSTSNHILERKLTLLVSSLKKLNCSTIKIPDLKIAVSRHQIDEDALRVDSENLDRLSIQLRDLFVHSKKHLRLFRKYVYIHFGLLFRVPLRPSCFCVSNRIFRKMALCLNLSGYLHDNLCVKFQIE
uniref:Uncharacterized protein n=1 Tax=Schistocephalus solidus TaxID=70667 RepID=A0A0V0J9A6_SCHSO